MTTTHPGLPDAVPMFKHVVVGIREDEAGLDAIALARELLAPDGTLTLLHVQVVAMKPSDSGVVRDRAKRRQALDRLTALAHGLELDAEVSCVQALSARRGLHQFASDCGADLLVVSTSRRDELGRDIIGDDAAEALENAPCAVAIAPSGYSSRNGGLTRVGVAYDGSAESERALSAGRTLASEHAAELSAFEAVGTPAHIRDSWDIEDEINEYLEATRRRVAALGDVEAEASFGEPVEEIATYEESVDLLVIGSHNYRPIDRVFRKSVAQRLADAASSPVLVLSSASHVSRI